MNNFEFKNNEKKEKNIEEKILSNPAFIRFAGGFKLYQNLININYDNNKDLITERMLDFHTPKSGPKSDNINKNIQQSTKGEELSQIINSTLQECQKNTFSNSSFANKLATSPVTKLFLSEWNRQEKEVEKESNMIHINELIAYKKESNNEISLHIRPTGTESIKLFSKIIDGLQKIGAELKTGNIDTNEIIMKSWLFNKKMEGRIKQIFGDEISIENISSDDNDIIAIQHLALQYNNKSLKKYLLTGEKPEVKQIIMTKDEFVARF